MTKTHALGQRRSVLCGSDKRRHQSGTARTGLAVPAAEFALVPAAEQCRACLRAMATKPRAPKAPSKPVTAPRYAAPGEVARRAFQRRSHAWFMG